jgi:hypothetical protein
MSSRHTGVVPGGEGIHQPDEDCFRDPIHFLTLAFVLRPFGRDEAPPNHPQLEDICAHAQD